MTTSAYSAKTDTHYDSWSDLVAAEANGYSIVSILRRTNPETGKTRTFARVVGPLDDKETAKIRAASIRAWWKRQFASQSADVLSGTVLVSVSIEPIWPEL